MYKAASGKRTMKAKNLFAAIFCFLTAFLLLMVCSRSSFLYPCNDWNDANSYFTMGKAMMNGQVIYRDLYDQKGPYLYLFYGLAYLLSHDSFAGVFVFEILVVGLFLYSLYKIIRLYCTEKVSLVLIPILAAGMLSSKSFYWGGAAEEFCLPLFGFSLYFTLKYFKEQYAEEVPPLKMILLNGLFAGIVMQVKYTMLGFYFAWMAMMAFAYVLKKDWRGFFKGCFTFLGAMLLTLVPWLLYFGLNGALDDWYQCYIYNNIFLYSNLTETDNGLGNRIYVLAKLLLWLFLDNLSYFVFIVFGVLLAVFSFRTKWVEKLNIIMLCGFLFLGIFVGGSSLPYYSIPLMVFAVLGMIPIGRLLDLVLAKTALKVPEKNTQKMRNLLAAAGMVLTLAIGLFFAYNHSMNPYFMQQEREDYFLFKFKEIIDEEENPTLLNVGCLDAGLYTVADVMPSCRFFQTNGIGFEEMFEEQTRYIKEGRTQFVLVRNDWVPEGIEEQYMLVAEEPYTWDGAEFIYRLYKRKTR